MYQPTPHASVSIERVGCAFLSANEESRFKTFVGGKVTHPSRRRRLSCFSSHRLIRQYIHNHNNTFLPSLAHTARTHSTPSLALHSSTLCPLYKCRLTERPPPPPTSHTTPYEQHLYKISACFAAAARSSCVVGLIEPTSIRMQQTYCRCLLYTSPSPRD